MTSAIKDDPRLKALYAKLEIARKQAIEAQGTARGVQARKKYREADRAVDDRISELEILENAKTVAPKLKRKRTP